MGILKFQKLKGKKYWVIKAVLWLRCFNAWAKQHWLTVAMSNLPKHPRQAWPRFVLKSSSCLRGICVGEGCGNNCIASNWKMGERIFLQIPQNEWAKPTAGRERTQEQFTTKIKFVSGICLHLQLWLELPGVFRGGNRKLGVSVCHHKAASVWNSLFWLCGLVTIGRIFSAKAKGRTPVIDL